MKIEVGESLIRSWLRHVEGCQLAELNWKPSPTWAATLTTEVEELFRTAKTRWPEAMGTSPLSQFIKQAEVDVLALRLDSEHQKVFLVDVAFHSGGLNYGGKQQTGERIYKKLVRSALLAKLHFPTMAAEIIFATPAITPATLLCVKQAIEKAQSIFGDNTGITIISKIGEDFKINIVDELLSLSSEVADTSEIFLRSWQLVEPFLEKPNQPTFDTPARQASLRSHESLDNTLKLKSLTAALYLSLHEHRKLDLGNQGETIKQLAHAIKVKPNTLKNQRDWFDRHIENHRKGWDKPLNQEMKDLLEKYKGLNEQNMRETVLGYF